MTFYKRSIVAIWKMFGFNKHFIFFIIVILFFMIYSAFTIITLLLDHIFFPKFRKVEVKKPVFIIGHPRSGTTFLHHLFTQTDEMAAFKAWHILFPGLTARVLLKPLVHFLVRNKKAVIVPESTGHEIALDRIEEEEMLFIHKHDTQFLIAGTPLGFIADDYKSLRFHDLQPWARRIKSARFFKKCFQRHIYYSGKKQVFAQTHFSTHRIKTLLEVFPDARFIYMDRTPYETLPSYFSLNYNSIDVLWGMHRFSKDQISTNFKYRYQGSLELYQYFFDLWHNNEFDKTRVLIIPYNKLRQDLIKVFEQIINFTGIESNKALREAVERQAEKQQDYKRRHEVKKLDMFGIDENRIEKDFAFLFEKDPDKNDRISYVGISGNTD